MTDKVLIRILPSVIGSVTFTLNVRKIVEFSEIVVNGQVIVLLPANVSEPPSLAELKVVLIGMALVISTLVKVMLLL